MKPELHLFVLWEKARKVESRIVSDLRQEMEILCVKELSFKGDPAEAYEAFYGNRRKMDGRLKVAKCGGEAFLLIVVRDKDPHYGQRWARDDKYYEANERMYDLKTRYREWAGRKHRVHGTTDCGEFARDVFLLTGHTADEWEAGVPETVELNIPAKASWRKVVEDVGGRMGLADCRVFLENKYINDVFFSGRMGTSACMVKCSSKCPYSIGNEFKLAKRLSEVAPEIVAKPLAMWTEEGGRRAFVVTERIAGPSLTVLLERGVTEEQANRFASDILELAAALRRTGILHRDLFPDNLLLGADGHLKLIDFQLAIDRNEYREDPWVERNWKFRYVVFGVNRELGLGVWNDFHALGKILALFPQTEAVRAARERLAAEEDHMSFVARPDRKTQFKLRFYAMSLRLQMLLRGRHHRNYAQLERRYRTIVGGM